MAQKREFGGLGIPNIGDMNLSLLASWVKKYHLDNNKLWKQIIDHKYEVNDPNLFCCSTTNISPFWRGVLWAKFWLPNCKNLPRVLGIPGYRGYREIPSGYRTNSNCKF